MILFALSLPNGSNSDQANASTILIGSLKNFQLGAVDVVVRVILFMSYSNDCALPWCFLVYA